MNKEQINIKKNLPIYTFVLLIVSLRLFFPYLSFSSSDLDGLMQKYIYFSNSMNIFDFGEIMLPLPYLPSSLNFYYFNGTISNFFDINYIFTIKYFNVIFDLMLAVLTFKFYCKIKKIKEKALTPLIIILLGPGIIFISSFYGFIESVWLFFFLFAIFIFEFEQKDKKNIFVPILLAIASCVKPISLFFVFYFFYKSNAKKLFIVLFISILIFLNLFFLIANIQTPNEILFHLKHILFKFSVGTQIGDFGLSEIEKIIKNIFDLNTFYFSKFIKVIEIFLILFVFYISLISKKIKSYEFVFSIFFIIYLLNDNLHTQYLYWIIPFSYLINFKKAVIGSIFLFFTIYFFNSSSDHQLLIFNHLDFFNFLSPYGNKDITNENYYLISQTILFYLYIFIIFEKKVFDKFKSQNFKFFSNFKKILFKSLNFKKDEKIFLKKGLNNQKYNFIVITVIIITALQFVTLLNVTKNKNKDYESLTIPKNLFYVFSHGDNYKLETNIFIKKIEDYQIIYNTGYVSKMIINNQLVINKFDILHSIHDPFYHNKNNEFFEIKKINIKDFLKSGLNNVIIFSNKPHSYESFGLSFNMYKNGILENQVSDFKWKIKKNNTDIYYNVKDLNNNQIFKLNEKKFEQYTNKFKFSKVLEYKENREQDLLKSNYFLFLIFSVLIFINILLLINFKKN